jgi:hypothetical protein
MSTPFPATRCFRQLAATGDDNPNVASSGPCSLKSIQGLNAKAAIIYLKLYHYTGSAPTSALTPAKTIAIPASAAFVFDFAAGFDFPKGLSYRVTAAAADNDGTALVASDFTCLNLDMA